MNILSLWVSQSRQWFSTFGFIHCSRCCLYLGGLLWSLLSEHSSTWGRPPVSVAWVHSLTSGACFSQHWAGQKYRSINTLKRERRWWVSTSATLLLRGTILGCVSVSQTVHRMIEPTQEPLINSPFNDFPSCLTSPPCQSASWGHLLNKLFASKSWFQCLILGETQTNTNTFLKMWGKNKVSLPRKICHTFKKPR